MQGPSVQRPGRPSKIFEPRIRWGGDKETLDRFPESWELDKRCEVRGDTNIGTPISLLHEAVVASSEQICILDPHFDKVGVHALVDALLVAPRAEELTIRIIGKDMKMSLREREELITAELSGVSRPRVEWRVVPDSRRYPFAHDRFCIVDDELIHFGGTVGGATPQLTAATGGWSAEAHDAYRFFDDLWNRLER